MTKPISILILCDCRESLSEELNDLRKQFTDESNTVKLTDLCDYFSDHILSNSEHFCDLFITFMDLILAHDMTVFVFSESHKRSPNRISELNSTITESPFKLDLSQSHIRTSESPSNCYYLMQLVSLFAGRFTSEASLDQKMFYFFKSSSVNCMESLVCHKRSNVHDFEDWKSIGFIIENKVAKLKQIFQLKSPIYENNENCEQSSGFISSKYTNKLEDILDRFCLSAFEDEDNYITPVNNILGLYKLKDWSYRLKRNDQRLR